MPGVFANVLDIDMNFTEGIGTHWWKSERVMEREEHDAVHPNGLAISGQRIQDLEGDIIRTIRDNIAHIGHFHTAGNPGRHDLDEMQELYYPAICRTIAATDYDG